MKTEPLSKSDIQNEAIFNVLRYPKFKIKGISTNKLFEQLLKNKVMISKSVFIKRIKENEKFGITKVQKYKNRKIIRLSDDIFSLENQLLLLQKYCDDFTSIINKKWQNADVQQKKDIFSTIRDEQEHQCWLFGRSVISNLMLRSKNPFQRAIFWSYYLPRYVRILDNFFYNTTKMLRKYVDDKILDQWIIELSNSFLRELKTNNIKKN